MTAKITIADRVARIQISGPFTYDLRHEFRDISEAALSADHAKEIRVDLGAVSYIDSSAPGLLLILRDKAKGAGKPISLTGANGTVEQIIRVAQFDRIFAST